MGIVGANKFCIPKTHQKASREGGEVAEFIFLGKANLDTPGTNDSTSLWDGVLLPNIIPKHEIVEEL